jgi:RNA polymerase sigma-70 factor, ECF subfamily
VDFEQLFRDTYPRVLAYARTLAPPDEVDDVVSETFAVAYRRRRDIPAGAELGWLIGVARRLVANRRRGTRRLGALRARLTLQPAAIGPDPAEHIDGDGELRAAVGRLAPLDREAVLLVAWFDLTPAEAAAALGISAAAFRMRLARARRKVVEDLDRDPDREETPACPAR